MGATVISLTKGLEINLLGKAENILSACISSAAYAVQPTDFYGITPHLLVQEGDKVQAGSSLFCDKLRQQIRFTSPVSGRVSAIVRGDRRAIQRIVIETDVENTFVKFDVPQELASAGRDEIVAAMLLSGAWAFIVQRPFGIVANPEITPAAIFISGFNTAPLAADADFLVNGESENFQAGINVLRKLTSGKIYLALNAKYPANKVFEQAKGVERVRFEGKHPAGNVGVQIHHIAPIGRDSVVWTIQPQHIIALGRLFTQGIYDLSKIVAVVGSEVKKPRYYRMMSGCALECIANLINQKPNLRVISGNVLTGVNAGLSGFLGFYDNEITVIPEGDNYEMLGWLMPRLHKFSHSRTYFSWLLHGKKYRLNTNLNGSHRAFVINGEYERVLPMDILPVYLLKAILAGDVERMEQLGICEVIEEDLALCEFVCTSKMDVQQILRRGINAVLQEYK